MREDLKLVRLIEELASNGWPAYIQQTLGAWKLRASSMISLLLSSREKRVVSGFMILCA